MNNRKTVLLAASTFLMSIVPLAAFNSRHPHYSTMAGVSGLLFLFASQELNRSILEESVPKRGRAVRDFIETFGVFTVVAAGLLTQIVPLRLALSTLVLAGVSKIFLLELSKRYSQSFEFRLGEKFWIAVVSISYMLYTSNPYFLFYGYLFLNLLMVYDLSGLFSDMWERPRV